MRTDIAGDIERYVRTRFRVSAGDTHFDRDAHLFEQGYVDSAGFAELVVHLEKHYAIALPDEILFSDELSSVAGIARAVERLLPHDEAVEGGDANAPVAIERLRAGDGAPLFCLYGAAEYRPLADALHDVGPVYPASWRLDAGASAPETVEEMSRAHVEAIRRTSAHGPYRVCGTSYGGLLAYEVAQQLTAAGERVELVALFDAELPAPVETSGLAGRLKAFARNGSESLRARVGFASATAPGAPTTEPLHRAATRYQHTVRPFGGRVVLYRAERAHGRAPDLGWSRVVRHLDVVAVDAEAGALLHAPAVHRIGEELRARTRAAR